MVALPVIDGVHRVAIMWKYGASGPTAVNVMHFKGAAADPAGLWTALDANANANMWLQASSSMTAYQVAITPLNADGATQIFTPAGAKWAGVGTPGDYSPATAVVLSLRTAKRGRRYRGRLFLPFPTETNMTSGAYAAVIATQQSAWNTFRTAMTTATWPMHVASYGHSLHRTKNPGGGYTLTPVTWTPGSELVTAATIESAFGTMRRRQSRLR